MGGSLRQAPDLRAGRPHTIDLKLRLALRVAALAAVCFLAVAAYALFESDRANRARASRIAQILAKDISLQQAQPQWDSLPPNLTPHLHTASPPFSEPERCISY